MYRRRWVIVDVCARVRMRYFALHFHTRQAALRESKSKQLPTSPSIGMLIHLNAAFFFSNGGGIQPLLKQVWIKVPPITLERLFSQWRWRPLALTLSTYGVTATSNFNGVSWRAAAVMTKGDPLENGALKTKRRLQLAQPCLNPWTLFSWLSLMTTFAPMELRILHV